MLMAKKRKPTKRAAPKKSHKNVEGMAFVLTRRLDLKSLPEPKIPNADARQQKSFVFGGQWYRQSF